MTRDDEIPSFFLHFTSTLNTTCTALNGTALPPSQSQYRIEKATETFGSSYSQWMRNSYGAYGRSAYQSSCRWWPGLLAVEEGSYVVDAHYR